jgi:hypothetical protein
VSHDSRRKFHVPCFTRHITLLACLLAGAVLGLASSIIVNIGTVGALCKAGTCAPSTVPDTLTSGASTGSTFNFIYVAADNDWYSITGDYSATNPASGETTIKFNVDATYVGHGGVNNTPATGADTFTITDLQDYDLLSSTYFTEFGTLNGTYSEDTDSDIGGPAGGSWQAQLFYNGQALPVMGPFTGKASASNAPGTALTGFGSTSTLEADFQFTYFFAQGTPAGAGFTSTAEDPMSPTPAPSSLFLVGAGILALMCYSARKRFGAHVTHSSRARRAARCLNASESESAVRRLAVTPPYDVI